MLARIHKGVKRQCAVRGGEARLIELQVAQVAEGKWVRGRTSGSCRLSGLDARLQSLILRAGVSTSREGVGGRTGLVPWLPKAQFLEHNSLSTHC